MDVTLIGDVADRSGGGHKVVLKGNTTVGKGGARFDGQGDYATIKSFHYADNATFSIAFWMTKVQCANGVYEYVYSHGQSRTKSILDPKNSNINMYIGCEKKQGGWSSLGGSVVRFNLVGSGGTWASWDYALHNAGNFDAITNKWMHVVLVVSPDRVLTYDDGKAVPDAQYGFFKYHSKKQKVANAAYPHPGSLKKAFKGFTLTQDIILGGRSDLNKQRHFMGRLAGLLVSKQTLTAAQVGCIFKGGEEFLSGAVSSCPSAAKAAASSMLSVSFLNNAGTAQTSLDVRTSVTAVKTDGVKGFTTCALPPEHDRLCTQIDSVNH